MCAVCAKPRIKRSWEDATRVYIRRRRLEAIVWTRRARACGGLLVARIGLGQQRMTADALEAAMARGACHWHRMFWRVER